MNRVVIFLLLNLAFPLLQAQETPMQVNHPDAVMKFKMLSHESSFKPDTSVIYCWFGTNEVHYTRGGYSGKLLDGDYSEFYNSGNLRRKGRFYLGLKDGEWREWHDNGNLREIANWKKGRREGYLEQRDESGQVLLAAEYKNNYLHGKYRQLDKGTFVVKNYKNNKEVLPTPPKVKAEKVKPAPKPRPAKVSDGTNKDSRFKTSFIKAREKVKALFKRKPKDPARIPAPGQKTK